MASGDGSKFEAIDVNSWLEEADQIDRVRRLADPDTRQFRIDAAEKVDDDTKSDTNPEAAASDDSTMTKFKKPEKKTPGKLPPAASRATNDSKQAADEALKRFFSR